MQANLNENAINGVADNGMSAFLFVEGGAQSSTDNDTVCDPSVSVNGACGPEPVPDPPD